MNKILYTTIMLLVVCINSQAQQAIDKSISTVQITNISHGKVDMVSDNLTFDPSLTFNPPAPMEKEQEQVEALQIQKTKLKLAQLNIAPTTPVKNTRATDPIFVKGWKANLNTGTPSDNTIATNTIGHIVSMVNSNIIIYDTAGTKLYQKSMSTFFKDNLIPGQLNNTIVNQCDPKVTFDCENKRFIAFSMTCDGTSANSRILIAVSEQEDPTKGWNTYIYKTNAFNAGVWFDYPRIGTNKNNIFISGNMFTDAGQFDEVYLFQMDKWQAYAGGATNICIVHRNITGNPFTISSVNQGLCTSLPTNHYLVSSNAGANNSTKFNLYEVIGNATDATTPTISRTQLTTSIPYSIPGYAIQKGTSVVLKTGDSRGHDAIMINGVIHFACHTDAGSGYSGIHYNRFTKSGTTWAVSSKVIKATNVEYAYPSLASFSNGSGGGTDQTVFMGLMTSSSTEYASIKAVSIDGSMNVSNVVPIKIGDNNIAYLTDSIGGFVTTRWGDYTGCFRQHYNSVPTVWIHGLHGDAVNTGKSWSNYIAKLVAAPEWPLSINNTIKNESITVFPNPTANKYFSINIQAPEQQKVSISLLDINGKQITMLLQAEIYNGNNTFTFNAATLASGTYMLQIIGNKNLQKTEKIIIQ
jgi:hypothetical protein